MNRAKNQQKVVLVGHLPDWVIEKYFSDVQVILIEESSRSDLLSSLDQEVIGIVARGSALIDSEVIQAAPNLQVIARTGAGYNTVDVEAASSRKIPVLYMPGAMSRAVAEHTVGLILAAVVASLLFGCVHFIPRREFLPWTGIADLATAWELVQAAGCDNLLALLQTLLLVGRE